MQTNHQWLLAARPEGLVKESDFQWTEVPLAAPGEGELLVRTVYLSLDPTNRVWMNEADSYMPALRLGEVMRGVAIGVVEESRHPDFAAGDLVQGLLGWQEYVTVPAAAMTKLPKGFPVPMTAFLGLLGHIGLTAYFGLLDIGAPKPGETLVVSTAAGAVGSLVGQIGKIKGCRVVGLTGSDEKCRWIKDDLGFDAAINYKTENVADALRRHCPKGIDIYFDHVGGATLEAVLDLINLRARIVVCGMITTYNSATPAPGPSNLINILGMRSRMEGFLCFDYTPRAEEAFTALMGWYATGKLKYRADVVDGLAGAPAALRKMFAGANIGKLLVQVSAEEQAAGSGA
jgi:NADPH-dependent curcumin reductase CurA